MSVTLDLTGRTAIVSGASRGIGEAIALKFADAGANVVAAARTESQLADTVAAVSERGADGLAVQTDLTSIEDIDDLIEAATEEFGVPDLLVNNAGTNVPERPSDITVEDADLLMDLNFRGLFFLTQRFVDAYRTGSSDSGRIINVSSIGAHIGIPAMTFYAGTKAGVNGLTNGFAATLAPEGVTVNAVSPGITRTERIAGIIEEKGDEVYDMDRLPLGRFAEPEDIADACLFLASDRADYITGQELIVDGGVSITAGLFK